MTKRLPEVPIASDNSRRNYSHARRTKPAARNFAGPARFADTLSSSAAKYNAGVVQPPVKLGGGR